MSPDELHPLTSYPWPYLAAGLILLAAALAALLFTRPRRAKAARAAAPETPGALRGSASDLRARFEAGEIDAREVHLRAAEIARRYGGARAGRDLTARTVAQLHAIDAPGAERAIAVVELAERPSFDVEPAEQAARVLDALDEMVAGS